MKMRSPSSMSYSSQKDWGLIGIVNFEEDSEQAYADDSELDVFIHADICELVHPNNSWSKREIHNPKAFHYLSTEHRTMKKRIISIYFKFGNIKTKQIY